MIISQSNKFMFVHIPKCAGISITDALVKTLKWNDIILHGGKPEYGAELEPYYERNFQLHGHQTANIIRRTIGDELWNNYFSFSFVRNPYARIVSIYNFVSRYVNGTDKSHWKEQTWYKWPISQAFLSTNSYSEFIRSHFFDKDHVTRDQFSWGCDENREQTIWDYIATPKEKASNSRSILEQIC